MSARRRRPHRAIAATIAVAEWWRMPATPAARVPAAVWIAAAAAPTLDS